MNDKLINYISMLEEEIKRIKEEYYSPEQVRSKEKYFRDETWKYRVKIKELKDKLERQRSELIDEIRHGAGI